MRTIKFRGREFFSKKFIYGQTIRTTDDGFDLWTGDDWAHCTELAQLVGYDKDGREVYEGDIIVDERGGETTADYRDNPEYVALHKLKAAAKMRPIKFRARDALGKASYVDWDVMLHPSVKLAQFVGYDKDGREVYEGDVVVGRDYEVEVKLVPNVVFKNFKLKEAAHETD